MEYRVYVTLTLSVEARDPMNAVATALDCIGVSPDDRLGHTEVGFQVSPKPPELPAFPPGFTEAAGELQELMLDRLRQDRKNDKPWEGPQGG